jgi:hypothetical protein
MTVAQLLRGNLRGSSLLHRGYNDLACKLPDLGGHGLFIKAVQHSRINQKDTYCVPTWASAD